MLLLLPPLLLLPAPATAATHSFVGTGEMRSNPERGFRDELHGACTQEWSSTRGEGIPDSDMQVMTQLNMTIDQVYCYLPNTTELTANDTRAIVNTAAQLRKVGAKALWRFAYDRTAGEKMYTADMIVGHMDQLKAVFNANIDVIYVLQAGWIGSWGEWHSSITGLEANKTAIQQIVGHELFSFLPPDKKLNIRVANEKAQMVLNVNPEPGDRLGMGIVTAANQHDNTAVSRIGFDNDAIMTDEWDCGTFFGGLGAYPSTDPDGKSRYGPNSSCTGIDGRGESCGDHGPNCTTNECDNRFPRSFGPVPSNNVTPGPPNDRSHVAKWVPNNLHGKPIAQSYAVPIFDSLHGASVDPDYLYAARESPYVPVDGEMGWLQGYTASFCDTLGRWPLKVSAEVFAWRLRDMHYSTLSMRHGYSHLDGNGRGKVPTPNNNETSTPCMLHGVRTALLQFRSQFAS